MSFASTSRADYDLGLRRYLLGVFNRMFGALMLTAVMALAASQPPLSDMLYHHVGHKVSFTLLGWLVLLSPLAILFIAAKFMKAASPASTGFILWSTAALFGLSSGSLLMRYTGMSLFETFLITAGTFGAFALFGYTTKANLTGMGNFLTMGLIGLIIATVVAAITHATAAMLVINIIGVLIFVGFTAYDVQKIKDEYRYARADDATMAAMQNLGALNLYLDFMNLFLELLSFFGDGDKDD